VIAEVLAVFGPRFWLVADHVLGVEFATDFVDRAFDGSSLISGVVAATRGDCTDLERMLGSRRFLCARLATLVSSIRSMPAFCWLASVVGVCTVPGGGGMPNVPGGVMGTGPFWRGLACSSARVVDKPTLNIVTFSSWARRKTFTEPRVAAGIEGLGNNQKNAAAGHRRFLSRLAAASKHFHAGRHRVKKTNPRFAGFESRKMRPRRRRGCA